MQRYKDPKISACRTEKHCNDMCKTKYKTPHWVGWIKYSYDFDFEVIGVFLCRKIKNFLFHPVFSSLSLSLYEDKKIKFIFICKNPSLRSDIWGTNYICLKRIGPDSRTKKKRKEKGETTWTKQS